MPLEGEQLGFLERVIKIINKYGLFKVFQALCVIGIFVYLMYNTNAIGDAIQGIVQNELETHSESVEQQHDDALKVRQAIKPEIDKTLKSVLTQLNADRVFILEMHNGNNNTSGLPFAYAEMTYEEVSDNITHIDDDYINLNLSRFAFPLILEEELIWQGSIKDLAALDDKLAKRLSSNDVTYFAIMQIRGLDNLLGYFGLSYCHNHEPKDSVTIIKHLTMAVQKLAVMLDANNIDNKPEIEEMP